jgi:hypothetical protein
MGAAEGFRAPPKALGACGQRWFALRNLLQREKDPAQRWKLFTQAQSLMLQALGHVTPPVRPEVVEFVAGSPVPVWAVLTTTGADHRDAPGHAPHLVIAPAFDPASSEEEPLEQRLSSLQYADLPVPEALARETWADLVGDAVFGAENPPRYVILVGSRDWLLLDRYKWPNNRALRFEWGEIFDRKDTGTLQAAAALLHRESLAGGSGANLLESLDENAHKHAFGVSEDLKYALREAIELLGNEAARQLEEAATGVKKSVYSGAY